LRAEPADRLQATAALVFAALALNDDFGAAEIAHARRQMMMPIGMSLRARPILIMATYRRNERGSHGEREG
jgi:hypothetical protein